MLKVRAGAGRNFLYYPPKQVEQVTVVESDVSMFRYAQVASCLSSVYSAYRRLAACLQERLIPLTLRRAGNGHWNRDTEHMLNESDFVMRSVRQPGTGIQPLIVLHALRPERQEQL